MKRSSPIFQILLGVGVILGPLCFCFIITGLSDKLDQARAASSEYQSINALTPLAGTHYQIEYTDENVTLKNTSTQAALPVIQHYSPVAAPPAYHLFSYAQRPYLIVRLASGGNSGTYWFKVFDLSGADARELTVASDNPDMGLSCNAPVLEQDSLKFLISTDCTFTSPYSMRVYWLPLR